MDISVVDLNRVEVYEAGASLITLLAYPREREEVWAQVHASLCSYALRIKSASEPDLATVRDTAFRWLLQRHPPVSSVRDPAAGRSGGEPSLERGGGHAPARRQVARCNRRRARSASRGRHHREDLREIRDHTCATPLGEACGGR